MKRSDRSDRRFFHVRLPTEVHDAVNDMAETMDLDTNTFLMGLIVGALRSSPDRLVVAGLKRYPGTGRRRAQPPGRAWKMKEPRVLWHAGPWQLRRVGISGRGQRPGDGWYLTGPSLTAPLFVSLSIREARGLAEPVIARHEHDQAG